MSARSMLSRRHVLAGLAGAAALGPTRAFAAGSCDPIDGSTQRCTVGLQIPLDVETVRQRCGNWCWAACIEAIFDLHNHSVAQESIVEKIYGGSDPEQNCEGGNAIQIIQAIDGAWIDQYGFQFQASADLLLDAASNIRSSQIDPNNPDAIASTMAYNMFTADSVKPVISELANGNPLLLGRMGAPTGHAMVLTAMTFTVKDSGLIQIEDLIVRDPWPDSANRRRLAPEEVLNTYVIVRVAVS